MLIARMIDSSNAIETPSSMPSPLEQPWMQGNRANVMYRGRNFSGALPELWISYEQMNCVSHS